MSSGRKGTFDLTVWAIPNEPSRLTQKFVFHVEDAVNLKALYDVLTSIYKDDKNYRYSFGVDQYKS